MLCLLMMSGAHAPAAQTSSLETLPQTLNYCIDPDWMPYEAIIDGEHQGMSADYRKLLFKGLPETRLLSTSSWSDTLKRAKQGHCHIVLMLNKTDARSQYLEFSDVYLRAANVLVSRFELPVIGSLSAAKNYRVGAVEGYRISEYIQTHYPEIDFVPVASEDEGLRQVEHGELDVYVGSMYLVNNRIQKQGLTNLRIVGWTRFDDALRVGVVPEYSYLLSRINQNIQQLTEQHHIDIYQRWNHIKPYNKTDHDLVWQISLPLVLLIFFLAYRYRLLGQYNERLSATNAELQALRAKLEDRNKELSYLSVHDPLTGLYNRTQVIVAASEQVKLKSRDVNDCSIVLLDIDDFKQLNDQFGHNTGDKVLKELSELLEEQAREVDVVGRWGGEEFILLCPGTNISNARFVAFRLKQEINNFTFSAVPDLTCSFGVSELHKGESFDAWLERADQALYKAKAQGKNCVCLAEDDADRLS
ncbi:diguanylate cyclase [Saliniradius amylolyticus]|nr:diguanylate cyclase [Saliniradius amylolyticus]